MKQGVVWVGLLAGCAADPASEALREPAVIVDAFPGGTLIYQGDDGAWQPVPAFGERFGFDVTDRYGVALVDPQRRVVDALFSTVAEQTHITWPAPRAVDRIYRVTGTAAGIGVLPGRVAGSLETVQLRSGEPYELLVAAGRNTLAFDRIDEVTGKAVSLILLRDLPIVSDLALDVDLADGLAVRTSPVRVGGGGGCDQRSMFSFGDTRLLLDRQAGLITFPHYAQWAAADHLTLELECVTDGRSATLFLDIPREHLIPTEVDAPGPPLAGDVFTFVDGRFHFAWQPYFYPTQSYQLTTTCDGCARWTSTLSTGWLKFELFDLDTFSPPDLAALGLLDPSLELPDTFAWSFTAHVLFDQRRIEATQRGRYAP